MIWSVSLFLIASNAQGVFLATKENAVMPDLDLMEQSAPLLIRMVTQFGSSLRAAMWTGVKPC